MDSEKNPQQIPTEILKEYKKMKRRERYLYERDKGRLIRFDEAYVQSGLENSIEDFISKRNLRRALYQALNDLDTIEYEIIQECFFDNEKPNYSQLSKKHSISKQAYTEKVKRILAKLKNIVTLYCEEF